MNNHLDNGWNIADKKEEVTCKHCLKAKNTAWGKKLIKQNIKK